MLGPLISLMQTGIEQQALRGENPEALTLIFLGIINNFIGKSAEMHMTNEALAHMLCGYFLHGALGSLNG